MGFNSVLRLDSKSMRLVSTSSKRNYCQKNGNDNGTTWKLEHINYYWRNEMSAFTQNCSKYPIFPKRNRIYYKWQLCGCSAIPFLHPIYFCHLWCIKRWLSRYFPEWLAPTHQPHKAISFHSIFFHSHFENKFSFRTKSMSRTNFIQFSKIECIFCSISIIKTTLPMLY